MNEEHDSHLKFCEERFVSKDSFGGFMKWVIGLTLPIVIAIIVFGSASSARVEKLELKNELGEAKIIEVKAEVDELRKEIRSELREIKALIQNQR